MEQQKNEVPVSKVPWVVREPSDQALEDSRFFKEVMRHEDKQKTKANLKLYSLLNNAYFPFYLPERYHSMDCAALKREAKAEGNYWAHATQFLFTNQMNGVFLWKLTSELGSDPSLFKHFDSLTFLDYQKKGEMFKAGIEQCKTSAEFLLNPWVLMQLPYQPALMLQWFAGVLTVIYDLRLEMVELYRWTLPFNVSRVVKKLFDLVCSMPYYAFKALVQINFYFNRFSRNDLYKNASAFLNRMTHECLPMLEFVTSGKARDIVRALKRMAFGCNYEYKNSLVNIVAVIRNNEWEIAYNCMFSDLFWRKGDLKVVIGASHYKPQEIFEAAQQKLLSFEVFVPKATPQWIAEMETKYGKDIKEVKIFALLKHLISKGIITNKAADIIQPLLQGCINSEKTYFTHCYYRVMELKANIDGGLRDADAGVLYDVLYTRTKYRIAEVELAMIAKLSQLCSLVDMPVQLNALNAEGPEMSLRQISNTLAEIKDNQKKRSKLSCWKDLKGRVPQSCRGKVDLNEECPSLAEEGAQKVAQKFEDRIKRLVLGVFEDLETWTENQIKINLDQQFIQYILPCFVASFLEFSENADVKQEHKQNYVKIVHELVKGFELKPYKVASVQGPFADGVSPYINAYECLIPQAVEWQRELLFKGLLKVLGSSPKAINIAKTIERNFLSVLVVYEKSLVDSTIFTKLIMEWRIQVYRLFRRILNAIEAAVPGSLPNLRVFDMAIISTICIKKHIKEPHCRNGFTIHGNKIKMNWKHIKALLFGTLMKAQHLLGVTEYPLGNFKVDDNFQLVILNECQILSLEQLAALVLYYAISLVQSGEGVHDHDVKGDSIRVSMDNVEEMYFAYKMGDIVKLKLLLGQMFAQHSMDLSQMTHEIAKNVAPFSYSGALDQVKGGKVQMQPCELTLLPFKHCRWCGLVQHDALRLCKECKDDDTFPFRTWFCGDECECLALDKLHREEHARHLEIDLGLEKERVELELESNGADAEKKKRKKKTGRAKK